MNIETNEALYSASMLITRNGYMVKVHKKVSATHYEKICFFVDNDFNFRVWKLTETRGMFLLAGEFYQLKCGRGNSQNRLTETGLLTPEQWSKAIEIAEKVAADPYYELDTVLKELYLNNGTYEGYKHLLGQTLTIAPGDMHKFKPAVNPSVPPMAKTVVAEVATVKAPDAEKSEPAAKATKKVAIPAPVVPATKRRAKVINDFSQLGLLSGAFI